MNRRTNFPAVIFDVDGCLADWSASFAALASSMGMGNHIVPTIKARYWDDLGGLTEDQISTVWRAVKSLRGRTTPAEKVAPPTASPPIRTGLKTRKSACCTKRSTMCSPGCRTGRCSWTCWPGA